MTLVGGEEGREIATTINTSPRLAPPPIPTPVRSTDFPETVSVSRSRMENTVPDIYLSRLATRFVPTLESSSSKLRDSDRIDRPWRSPPRATRHARATDSRAAAYRSSIICRSSLILFYLVDTFWTTTPNCSPGFPPFPRESFAKSGQTIAYADETVRKRLGTHDLVPRGHDTPGCVCVCVCVCVRENTRWQHAPVKQKLFAVSSVLLFFFLLSFPRFDPRYREKR